MDPAMRTLTMMRLKPCSVRVGRTCVLVRVPPLAVTTDFTRSCRAAAARGSLS
jgi:hypothetical protein